MTTRAMRFLKEALPLIGEQAPKDLDLGTEEKDPTVIDDTAGDGDLGGDLDTGGDDLGLGAEPEDEFGLGASSAPSVRIEKDGPITVNKGDVELTIGDDGNIDITLDGGTGDLSEPAPSSDLGAAPPAEEETPEEDDYKIDWDKEKEELPKESLEPVLGAEGAVLESKARQVLNMEAKPVLECIDSKYECMSCGSYDECQDKAKKAEPQEDETDFLTQGYL